MEDIEGGGEREGSGRGVWGVEGEGCDREVFYFEYEKFFRFLYRIFCV